MKLSSLRSQGIIFLALLLNASFLFAKHPSSLGVSEPSVPSRELQYENNSQSRSLDKYFTQTTFLDLFPTIDDLIITQIVGYPPIEESVEALEDEAARAAAYDNATKEETWNAVRSEDSIFSYAYTLGSDFNAKNLPKTNALFRKIDDDARLAVHVAKYIFQRRRPLNSNGFAYPSGHSTRAFIWESLLSMAFPGEEAKLYNQAKVKAWNRVILGRHYPADVEAGETYGIYLTQKFLENASFKKEWAEVCQEIQKKFPKQALSGV